MRSDEDLANAWRGGDRDAAQELIARHYDAIVRFFRAKVTGAPDELVQGCFLACAESISRWRGEATFRAFLFGIARMKLLEHLRGKARDRKIEPDFAISSIIDCDPGLSTVLGRDSELRQLRIALSRLPVAVQTLLELYYWEELQVSELAHVFETKPGTIKSRLFAAREQLREELARTPASEPEREEVKSVLQTWAALDAREQAR